MNPFRATSQLSSPFQPAKSSKKWLSWPSESLFKTANTLPELLLILGAYGVIAGLLGCNLTLPAFANTTPSKRKPLSDIEFQTLKLPTSTAYVLRVPKNPNFVLFPSVAGNLDSVERQIMNLSNSPYVSPIGGINAGFFDPKAGSNISFVVKNGETIANPEENLALMNNKTIAPYLDDILNRSEFRVLDCMTGLRYDIQRHREAPPMGCTIRNSVQAGPKLNDAKAVVNEAFAAYDSAGKVTRDPIGFRYKNARSAMGIDELGQPILVMVTQRPPLTSEAPAPATPKPNTPSTAKAPVPMEAPPRPTVASAWNLDLDQVPSGSGLSISELGDLMKRLGAVKAMALDGGSSSSMWVTSKNFFGKVNNQRLPIQRRVKSIWVVGRKKS